MATQPIDRQKFKQAANKKAYKTPSLINKSGDGLRQYLVSQFVQEDNRRVTCTPEVKDYYRFLGYYS